MNPELESLRKRVKSQRRELRRLNQLYTSLLIGYRNGVRAQSLYGFRQRMEQAFGCEAVWRAERGLTASGVSTHAPPPAGAVPATPPFPSSSLSTSPRPGSEPGTSLNPST